MTPGGGKPGGGRVILGNEHTGMAALEDGVTAEVEVGSVASSDELQRQWNHESFIQNYQKECGAIMRNVLILEAGVWKIQAITLWNVRI